MKLFNGTTLFALLIVAQFFALHFESQALTEDPSCCTEGDVSITQSIRRQLNCCCEDLQNGLDEILEKLPCSEVTPIKQAELPYTITAPGKYCIAENLTVSSGTAITISADNVLLDFDLHSLTLEGVNPIGIYSGAFSNLNIKDPVINISGPNRATAISAINSKNVLIQRPIIQDTAGSNDPNIAISLRETRDVIINQPEITACSKAVEIISGQNAVIKDGNVTSVLTIEKGAFNDEIAIADSKNVSILNTNVSYSGVNCVRIEKSSNVFIDKCIITAFSISEFTQTGCVRIEFSTNCLLANSIINAGSKAIGDNGFLASASLNNSIENCEISNFKNGIQLSNQTTTTAIVATTIRNCNVGIANSSTSTLLRNSNIYANTQNITGTTPLQITPTDNVIF